MTAAPAFHGDLRAEIARLDMLVRDCMATRLRQQSAARLGDLAARIGSVQGAASPSGEARDEPSRARLARRAESLALRVAALQEQLCWVQYWRAA